MLKFPLSPLMKPIVFHNGAMDFRPEYTQLGGLKAAFPNAPIMALTATADYATRQDILTHLKLDHPHKYIGSFDRPNIRYTLEEKFKPMEQLTRFVLAQKEKAALCIAIVVRRWNV